MDNIGSISIDVMKGSIPIEAGRPEFEIFRIAED